VVLSDPKLNDFQKWLASNNVRLANYYKDRIEHEAVDYSNAMDSLAICIKNGDQFASEIGFDLLEHDHKMPFGKIVKSKILNAFRYNKAAINERRLQVLIKLHEKWSDRKPYPPREIRYLKKLLRALSINTTMSHK
jgi:predicted HTH domain antitoxin